MRRFSLLAALLISLRFAAPAAAQRSQASGLIIKQVSSPSPGKVQVLAAPEAPHDSAIGAQPQAKDFTVWLEDGAARGLSVARNGARAKPLTTIILIDESGSYKKGVGESDAVPAVTAYVKAMPVGDEVGLVVFATDATTFPIRSSSADFLTDLAAAGKRPGGVRTNLMAGLGAAIDRAAAEGEPGLRDVILFSDAGDEAQIADRNWQELIAKARARGVRVSVVLPASPREPTGVARGQWLSALVNLKDLVAQTSGLYDNSGDPKAITQGLNDGRAAAKSWLVFEGTLCGMKPGQGAGVRVEYGPQTNPTAWSGAGRLDAGAWAPGSDQPCQECRGPNCKKKPCAATCATWQDCDDGSCVARACADGEACGPGAICDAKDKRCAPVERSFLEKNLPWLLIGAALLLALAAAALLRQRPVAPPPPVVTTPPEPLRSPPAPEAAPPTPFREAAGPASPMLDPLPETHLKAVSGWSNPGEKWRLYKQKMRVGSASDLSDSFSPPNDIVFPVKMISGHHAQFELYPSGDLWITDLGSLNGTFVNGERLGKGARGKLQVGDTVKLSRQLTLTIVRPGSNQAQQPEEPARQPEAPAPAQAQAPATDRKKTKFDPGNR